MNETTLPHQPVRFRSLLELATNIAVFGAACAIIWSLVFRGEPQLEPRSSLPVAELPTAPISLAGAQTAGNAQAKVAILEFSDFQCPFCARFSRDTLPEIRRRYIESGRVLLAFRHLPLTQIHPLATQAAEGTECAARQGRFWAMHDAFFDGPADLSFAGVEVTARSLGLEMVQFDRCLAGEAAARVRADAAAAAGLRVTGTPTFFIGTLQDGKLVATRRLAGALPIGEFAAALEPLLESTARPRE